MMKYKLLGLVLAMGLSACKSDVLPGARLLDAENLVAWCIVPFDAEERTPAERARMLRDLGLKHFAYDYRQEHIPFFMEEMEALKDQGIALDAVWLWVDPRWEEPLDEAGRQVLDILGESGTRTEIWMGFPEDAFEGMGDDQSLSLSIGVVKEILRECGKLGCTLALYNHGGWFGEPENLVRIVESVGPDSLRIVYNFHHGHRQVDRFEENLARMLPYLSTININGMRADGPKILTLGEGDLELEMLRAMVASGYDGPVGILGHTEGKDIMPVLEANLKGLEKLKEKL